MKKHYKDQSEESESETGYDPIYIPLVQMKDVLDLKFRIYAHLGTGHGSPYQVDLIFVILGVKPHRKPN